MSLNYRKIADMQKKEAAAINKQLEEIKRKSETLKKKSGGGRTA